MVHACTRSRNGRWRKRIEQGHDARWRAPVVNATGKSHAPTTTASGASLTLLTIDSLREQVQSPAGGGEGVGWSAPRRVRVPLYASRPRVCSGA